MNVLIIVIASVSAGWAAQRLYHACFYSKNSRNQGEDVDVQPAEEENQKITQTNTSSGSKAVAEEEAAAVVNAANVEKDKTSKKEAQTQVKKIEEKTEQPTQLEDDHVDDLTQLKGVGPKLSQALEEIGVHNYEQIFEPSIDLLLARLRETGGRFTRPALTAIVERARLAAKER